jgi:hypothetical protein
MGPYADAVAALLTKNIHASQRCDCFVYQAVPFLFISHVCRERDASAACRFDFGTRLLERFAPTRRDCDVGSVLGQGDSNRAADSL